MRIILMTSVANSNKVIKNKLFVVPGTKTRVYLEQVLKSIDVGVQLYDPMWGDPLLWVGIDFNQNRYLCLRPSTKINYYYVMRIRNRELQMLLHGKVGLFYLFHNYGEYYWRVTFLNKHKQIVTRTNAARLWTFSHIPTWYFHDNTNEAYLRYKEKIDFAVEYDRLF